MVSPLSCRGEQLLPAFRQQQVSAQEEGHLVLQMSFPWILPFLTCFCFNVKVSLLCSVSEVFGRQVRLLCPPGREEGGGRYSEEPADHLGCPLRQHPLFLSYFVFLNPNILRPKAPRTHREVQLIISVLLSDDRSSFSGF